MEGGTRPHAYVQNPNAEIDPWGLAKATECCLKFSSYEKARNEALADLEKHSGLNPSTREPHLKRDVGGTPAAGMIDGFSGKLNDGRSILYRLDYSPKTGGTHINLLIGKGENAISKAYYFPGNQEAYLNLLKQFQR